MKVSCSSATFHTKPQTDSVDAHGMQTFPGINNARRIHKKKTFTDAGLA